MTILQKKFEEYYHATCWVPDWNENENIKCSIDINTVLIMGSYFERIFQPNFWPDHDFKLFCLSSRVKKVLNELFLIESNTIGTFDRYDLFPKSNSPLEFPTNFNFNLIHIGRISPQKNIEFVILINFFFQLEYNPDMQLYLYGKFDNEYHHQSSHFYASDYKFKIYKLIESLPWVGPKPILIHDYDQNIWKNNIPEKVICVSTSDLISEDFSVAVAEIQELGIPALIPNWGGFVDVHGINIKKYDPNLIANSNNGLSEISSRAKSFVTNFETLIKNSFKNDIIHNQNPIFINKDYLEIIYQKNIQQHGEEIELIRNKKFGEFVSTDVGKKLIKKYFTLFGETP